MEVRPCLCLVFFLMLSSFLVFNFLCTVDMVHCGYPHLVRASLICSLSFHLSSSSVTSVLHLSSKLVTYGSLTSSGVMDGVRKSLRVGLYVCYFGRLVVSPLPIPSSPVKCPNVVCTYH